MFALGEIEALIAAFARLFLFLLFPGTLLKVKTTEGASRSSVRSSLNEAE